MDWNDLFLIVGAAIMAVCIYVHFGASHHSYSFQILNLIINYALSPFYSNKMKPMCSGLFTGNKSHKKRTQIWMWKQKKRNRQISVLLSFFIVSQFNINIRLISAEYSLQNQHSQTDSSFKYLALFCSQLKATRRGLYAVRFNMLMRQF